MLSTVRHVFTFFWNLLSDTKTMYCVSLETVLCGHEGWVYGVHWQPPYKCKANEISYPMRLLTASMDKTMIIWEPDPETGAKLKPLALVPLYLPV